MKYLSTSIDLPLYVNPLSTNRVPRLSTPNVGSSQSPLHPLPLLEEADAATDNPKSPVKVTGFPKNSVPAPPAVALPA